MKNHADAGDWLIDFWQASGNVICNDVERPRDMNESRWFDAEAVALVRCADLQKLDGMEFDVSAAGVKSQALFGGPFRHVAIRRCGEFFFQGFDLLAKLRLFAGV